MRVGCALQQGDNGMEVHLYKFLRLVLCGEKLSASYSFPIHLRQNWFGETGCGWAPEPISTLGGLKYLNVRLQAILGAHFMGADLWNRVNYWGYWCFGGIREYSPDWCRHLYRSCDSSKHRQMVRLPCLVSQCVKLHVAGWTWAVFIRVYLESCISLSHQSGNFWEQSRIFLRMVGNFGQHGTMSQIPTV
jgi:hypothetical protein